MRSQTLIICLVLALAPAGILLSRMLVPADEAVLQAPVSQVALQNHRNVRDGIKLSGIRPASAE